MAQDAVLTVARASARQRGYDTQWQKVRAAYLAAHPLCVMCSAQGRRVAAIGNPATAYGYVTDSRPGEDPIIELMVEEYTNRYGRQVEPLLAIVDWAHD